MKLEARRDVILSLLEKEGRVRVSQLSKQLGVSAVTIRTDLSKMEEEGLLKRVQGGAVQTTLSLYNHEFQRRRNMHQDAKTRIGALAADMINDGDSLFINGGSTTYYTALELKKKQKLSVVTNALNVAIELAMCPSFSVILVGGTLNPYYSFMYGSDALNQLRRYRVSKTIISIDGINGRGITTIHPEEAAIVAAMIERADCRMIVADGSKVGNEGFVNICGLDMIDVLLTDETADRDILDEIRAQDVDIHLPLLKGRHRNETTAENPIL
ncbi:MAG: DeoR/GlpR family DNA-binding transcription regulator [Christensenellales bacterium]|jgi:DeoR family transcriptional regulator of aga operon